MPSAALVFAACKSLESCSALKKVIDAGDPYSEWSTSSVELQPIDWEHPGSEGAANADGVVTKAKLAKGQVVALFGFEDQTYEPSEYDDETLPGRVLRSEDFAVQVRGGKRVRVSFLNGYGVLVLHLTHAWRRGQR